MLRPALLLLALALPPAAGAAADSGEGADENRAESAHLIVEWSDGVEADAVEMALAEGERHYAALRDLLGHEPQGKVTILLLGPAERPDGTRGHPRVSRGKIHLYRFTPGPEGYFSALAHEMVHVFRLERRFRADWFFEEGFAEFAAREVDPSRRGFPWYGFPVTVVAGQWLDRGEEIPLATLRENHRALNQPCKAQSYALRSAFFLYLAATHGRDALLAMAARTPAGALDDYEHFFGRGFEALAAEWRQALLTAFRATEGVDELARRYREESPIQYNPVCRKGSDF